jgi:hypothetical protein
METFSHSETRNPIEEVSKLFTEENKAVIVELANGNHLSLLNTWYCSIK